MHLKTLTLKGFKSFASATTLRFEPGITCVVGPNGSGKSNVVDAIAWVLGEQGAKALRGGKMEDVIFAGTADRPPLGRAEVTLTIDNSDGALPIDYAEVSITRPDVPRRRLGEYEINGNSCRLLDIQELLSDSGIGREMHVIVGQGQLDAVLQARPEDRRAFIEEAAGVLKHRKRKEKALRKLDAMQANLNRLTDLTGEIRRQLRPLGRQAEVARRAAGVQADLRDARMRLLADDLATMRAAAGRRGRRRDRPARPPGRGRAGARRSAQAREAELEAALAEQTPRLARAQETWYRLAGAARAVPRHRLAGRRAAPPRRRGRRGARPGRDPEALEAEAAQVRASRRPSSRAWPPTPRRSPRRSSGGRGWRSSWPPRSAAGRRAARDRRPARGPGEADRPGRRAAQPRPPPPRPRSAGSPPHWRPRASGRPPHTATTPRSRAQVAGLDAGEVDLDARYEATAAALAEAEERLATLVDEEREVERQRSAAAARRDALALGLARKDGHGALLAARDRLPGVLGTVAEVVAVQPGYEAALAAALGHAADAVAVTTLADAAAALPLLKTDDAGRAGIVVGAAGYEDGPAWPALPAGARYAVDVRPAPRTRCAQR